MSRVPVANHVAVAAFVLSGVAYGLCACGESYVVRMDDEPRDYLKLHIADRNYDVR